MPGCASGCCKWLILGAKKRTVGAGSQPFTPALPRWRHACAFLHRWVKLAQVRNGARASPRAPPEVPELEITTRESPQTRQDSNKAMKSCPFSDYKSSYLEGTGGSGGRLGGTWSYVSKVTQTFQFIRSIERAPSRRAAERIRSAASFLRLIFELLRCRLFKYVSCSFIAS